MVMPRARLENTLDLVLTNTRNFIQLVESLPGISDHKKIREDERQNQAVDKGWDKKAKFCSEETKQKSRNSSDEFPETMSSPTQMRTETENHA
ncbi:hypothetical protein BaRGS_00034997 [Batillaria attramentaria]|uniref:Uncharacterized protein n=1 Tax=Batillaria attramentaria TaxID=370345 RepID=A0ABD0JG78_9CAEN